MISATNPVTTPARTLNQWWITRLQMSVIPGTNKVSVSYMVTLGDATGPDPTQTQQPRLIPDVAALFAGDQTSLTNLSTATTGIEALIQKDMQNRGVL